MNTRAFFIFFAGFLGGVAFRSFFSGGIAFSAALVGGGFAIVMLAWKFSDARRNHWAWCLALFLFAVALGMMRADSSNRAPDIHLEKVTEEYVSVTGLIVEEPDVRENQTRLIMRPRVPSLGENETEFSRDKILMVTELHPTYHYGDTVAVAGVLKRPQNFTGDTGREFDYVSYLAKDGIRYELFYPRIEVIERGGGSAIKRMLFSTKSLFIQGVKSVLPEPHAALVGGLLVGAKQSLGTDLLDNFRAAGLIHLVVLSGYNITIIAEFIGRVARKITRRRSVSMAVSALGIVAFATVTGASATVVRASLMALLVLLARLTGRVYDITRALFAAALLMVAVNPRILVFDPSFQLSFLATFALITLAPRIEPVLRFLPKAGKLRETATATIATQIFVLPFLLYLTGELSLVALPANLLVLIAIPATMLAGFFAGLMVLVSTALALPFASVAYVLLSYILAVVRLVASVPFASVSLPSISFSVVVVIYVAILIGARIFLRPASHPLARRKAKSP